MNDNTNMYSNGLLLSSSQSSDESIPPPPPRQAQIVGTAQQEPSLIDRLRLINETETRKELRLFKVDFDLVKFLQKEANFQVKKSKRDNHACVYETHNGDKVTFPLPVNVLERCVTSLDAIMAECQCENWEDAEKYHLSARNSGDGWLGYILKVHQVLAELLDLDLDDECEPVAKKTDADHIDLLSSNALEAMSLTHTMTRFKQVYGAKSRKTDEKFGDDLYRDYHRYGSGFSPASISSSSPNAATGPYSPTDAESNNMSNSPHDETSSGVELYVGLRSEKSSNGVWEDLLSRYSEEEEEEEGEDARDWSKQMCAVDGNRGLFLVDLDYMKFSLQAYGRFDAYLTSLFGLCLKGMGSLLKVHPPRLLLKSWNMVSQRARHAMRVFRDAKGPYRMSTGKLEWYSALLAGGSINAVQDTFTDLANELWHAQFNKGDKTSHKRLETLLVSLLGHSDKMVRSQAVVLLNSYYDQHDWQQDYPFLPQIREVGKDFLIEIVIDDPADAKLGQCPTGVFLILMAPSFDQTFSACEIYSYFEFEWTPVSTRTSLDVDITKKRFQGPFGTTNTHNAGGFTPRIKGLHRWTGKINFGKFPRCGFYDWRVVRADEVSGSWETVRASLADLKRSFSSSLSFVEYDNQNEPTSFTIKSRNLFAQLIRLCDMSDHSGNEAVVSQLRTLPLQGRFIVQPNSITKEQVHELFVDQYDIRFGADGNVEQRGSFTSVASSLAKLKSDGVTTVYLMGALARDNGEKAYTPSGDVVFERPNVSPFAVTCRGTPCEMLGGISGFRELIREARRVDIKIVVDSLSRVSSSRHHRKYRPHILHTIDDTGKRNMLYGSDGRSVSYEDTCQLNYRKVEAWDLLVQDLQFWACKMGCSGVVFDNAHAWPQIMKADVDELSRCDPDGQAHYSAEEKLRGDVVIPFTESESGYWSSAAAESFWPNPLFVRVCRDLWRDVPDFMLIAECPCIEGMERRPNLLLRSGTIPQLQGLPNYLSKIFGKEIKPDGSVIPCAPGDASSVARWYELCHEDFPEGAVVIQSSCSHSSPLPGLLYGRGAWPAVDLLFLLSDVPATFMGEDQGSCFRLDIASVFQTTVDTKQIEDSSTRPSIVPASPSPKKRMVSVKSLVNFAGKSAVSSGGNTPTPSNDGSKSPTAGSGSPAGLFSGVRSLAKFEPLQSLPKLEEEQVKKLGPEFGFDLTKIGSHYIHRRMLRKANSIFQTGILVPLLAQRQSGETYNLVLAFCRLDIESGAFALCLINFSSEELTNVAVSLKVLKKHYHQMGKDASTVFKTWNLYQKSSSTHASVTDKLFAPVSFDINMIITNDEQTQGENDGTVGLITIGEMLVEPQVFHLQPYGSKCVGFEPIAKLKKATRGEKGLREALFVSSLRRLEGFVRSANAHRIISSEIPMPLCNAIRANHIIACLLDAVHKEQDIGELARVLADLDSAVNLRNHQTQQLRNAASGVAVGSTASSAMMSEKEMSVYEILADCGVFEEVEERRKIGPAVFVRRQQHVYHPEGGNNGGKRIKKVESSSLFVAKLTKMLQGKSVDKAHSKFAGAYNRAKEILEKNQLGPIVLMTTELGKWSTVGGLGVMVDELSVTLANDLGQQVWVVTPYYDRNRKGETGYLERDGVCYKMNVKVTVAGQEVTLGVHEGMVKGVRLIFLHNSQWFGYPYPDFTSANAVRYLSVIGKAFLEVICQMKEIPQLIVTNDWPTGLIPAYAKQGHFGSVFQSTTFFHICHNFDPAYEGRVYPEGREELSWIHGLPHDLLVDPLWAQPIYNPSRCALLQCDAWGTVSPSYRDDLKGLNNPSAASPLAPLLNRYRTPFATPNGIPIEARRARLRALECKNHAEAKGLLQKKYFRFQKPDLDIPIFAFVGRITSQKGVHLILDAAEGMIRRYNQRLQILVGGKVNWKEPYSARCGQQMYSLKDRFPYSFYADPNEFFTDGALVNLGADFGLMPSAFEPGGIVQHEFFVAGTPVIAFRTGGLKDTVFEFNPEDQTGNGFTFEAYTLGDFLFATERAQRIYQSPAKYAKLRRNCEESVVSCEECATAWLGEFCRLRRKIRVNPIVVEEIVKTLPTWNEDLVCDEEQTVDDDNRRSHDGYSLESPSSSCVMGGGGSSSLTTSTAAASSIVVVNRKMDGATERKPIRIKFVPEIGQPRPRSVAIAGSFDDWRVRRPMAWDNSNQAFTLNLALSPGTYFYKIVMDGVWQCDPNVQQENDDSGISNNVIHVI